VSGKAAEASSGTIETGTSLPRTAETASGSAPAFHSTPSFADVSPISTFPGTSIAPIIAWTAPIRAATDASVRMASARFVHGPIATTTRSP